MIQGRAEALAALITRRRQLSDHQVLLNGFRRQREEVENAVERLTALTSAWRLLRAKGIAIGAGLPEASAVLQQTMQLRERYNADPAFILGPGRLSAVKSGVLAFAASLEGQLLNAWRVHAVSQVPNVTPEVLNVLARIGALRPQVDRIWAGLRDLESRAARLPATETEIDELDRKVREVSEAWNEFDTSHLPVDVWQFLKEAAGSGAALARLTDPVRAWLEEHELSSAFAIRPTL